VSIFNPPVSIRCPLLEITVDIQYYAAPNTLVMAVEVGDFVRAESHHMRMA
jgi:hypothetical protein